MQSTSETSPHIFLHNNKQLRTTILHWKQKKANDLAFKCKKKTKNLTFWLSLSQTSSFQIAVRVLKLFNKQANKQTNKRQI